MGTVRTYGATRRSNVRNPTRQYIAASFLVSSGESSVSDSIASSPPSSEGTRVASLAVAARLSVMTLVSTIDSEQGPPPTATSSARPEGCLAAR